MKQSRICPQPPCLPEYCIFEGFHQYSYQVRGDKNSIETRVSAFNATMEAVMVKKKKIIECGVIHMDNLPALGKVD